VWDNPLWDEDIRANVLEGTFITNPHQDEPHDLDSKIDLVIVGGESGPSARPMHPDWARSIRDQCKAADVSFFFKQMGSCTKSVEILDTAPPMEHLREGQWVSRVNGSDIDRGSGPFQLETYTRSRSKGSDLLDGIEYKEWPE
jgi:hypothetical protein